MEITIANLPEILGKFGLTCYRQRNRLGSAGFVIEFERTKLAVALFLPNGTLSHCNWLYFEDPYKRAINSMDYYRVAVSVYVETGVEIDAPAWSDLVERANDLAQEKYAKKLEARAKLPVLRKGGKVKQRQPISPPNPIAALHEIVRNFVTEVKYGKAN